VQGVRYEYDGAWACSVGMALLELELQSEASCRMSAVLLRGSNDVSQTSGMARFIAEMR